MTESVLLYAGVILLALGAMTLARPMRRLRIPTRARAVAISGVGVMLVLGAMFLPAAERRVGSVSSHLDREMPVYQFHERHVARVAAPPESAYAAIKAVTANEIRFFRTLTWIRRGGRELEAGILNAPATTPILDVALEGGFVMLVEVPGSEIVLGTLVKVPPGARGKLTADVFRGISAPGFAKATFNFRVVPDGPGKSIVSTETRVYATDDSAKRAFARYWRVIYPGSALIRRSWLQAIRRRAEREKGE